MTIFIKLFRLIKAAGFVIILFCFSYLITSTIYYSRDHEISKYDSIDIFVEDNIEVIEIVNGEYISIDVRLKKELNEKYLIAYTLTYLDKYQKNIHLYVVDKNMIINVGKNRIYICTK